MSAAQRPDPAVTRWSPQTPDAEPTLQEIMRLLRPAPISLRRPGTAVGPWPRVRPVLQAAFPALAMGLAAAALRSSGITLADHLLDGFILLTGGASAAVAAWLAARAAGAERRTWLLILLTMTAWTAFLWGGLQGWPGWLVLGVLRPLTFVGAGLAIRDTPGVRRTGLQWLVLLAEGWLLAGSALSVTWAVLTSYGVTPASLLSHGFSYSVVHIGYAALAIGSSMVIGGLGLRSPRTEGRPGIYVALGILVVQTGDVVWAATGDARVGAAILQVFSACMIAMAMAPQTGFWDQATAPDRIDVRRPAHVLAIPGLIAVLVIPPDPVAAALGTSLLLTLGVEIIIRTAVLRQLWIASVEQADRLDTVLRESRDAILALDDDGILIYANPASADVLGHEPDRLVGTELAAYAHPDDVGRLSAAVLTLQSNGGSIRVLGRCRRSSGAWRHVESTVSRVSSAAGERTIIVARDVEDRVRLESELRTRAETDALTGLLNRQAFLTALQAHLHAGPIAVLFCDLDGFKVVNDTEGHASGDAVLRRAGEAIAQSVQPGQLVARLGGDEFAVLVPPGAVPAASALQSVERAAESVCEVLISRLPRTLRDGRIGVSIGVAVRTGPPPRRPGGADTDHAQELLRDADLAMYEAKAAGGGTWVRFEPAMRERVIARSQLRDDLERAIADEGLSIDLQPIVDSATGAWSQFEALVRWQDGDRRRSPAEFLPVAEESGLMVPLGAWVLRASLAWLARWPDTEAGISVNVTGAQVAHRGFVEMVCTELVNNHISPERLTLEITEQTAVQDLDRASAVLQPLRQLGVHVALDDFGTGYCSLGYLAQLPVDELKIDRKFVDGLSHRREDDALVRAVLTLARDLRLRVVAEGVETEEQATILTRYGCPLMQGYLYSRPVPAGQLSPPPSPSPVPALTSPALLASQNTAAVPPAAVPRQAGPGRAVAQEAVAQEAVAQEAGGAKQA